jgi:hypothetical protein
MKLIKKFGELVLLIALLAVALMFKPAYGQTAAADSGSFLSYGVGSARFVASGYVSGTDTHYTKAFAYPAAYDTNITFYSKCTAPGGDSTKVKFVLQEYAADGWVTVATVEDSNEVQTVKAVYYHTHSIPRMYRFAVIGLGSTDGSPNGYLTAWKIDVGFRRWP